MRKDLLSAGQGYRLSDELSLKSFGEPRQDVPDRLGTFRFDPGAFQKLGQGDRGL